MKTARLLAIALLVGAAIVIGATSAGAQSIPETPIGSGPHAATPAIEPIVTWSSTAHVTLLPAPAGGPFTPVLPLWLPMLQWSSSQGSHAATRETASPRATKGRNQPGRIASR